ILTVTLRVLLGTGVAHRDVEEAVRAELNTAATVILRCAHHLQQPPRRLARVAAEIRRGPPFDDRCRNPSLLEHLMLEIVFAVLAKARMERETKHADAPALIEDLLLHIGEQGCRFLGRALF